MAGAEVCKWSLGDSYMSLVVGNCQALGHSLIYSERALLFQQDASVTLPSALILRRHAVLLNGAPGTLQALWGPSAWEGAL